MYTEFSMLFKTMTSDGFFCSHLNSVKRTGSFENLLSNNQSFLKVVNCKFFIIFFLLPVLWCGLPSATIFFSSLDPPYLQ